MPNRRPPTIITKDTAAFRDAPLGAVAAGDDGLLAELFVLLLLLPADGGDVAVAAAGEAEIATSTPVVGLPVVWEGRAASFSAAAVNAAMVFPDVGALILPTMPLRQCTNGLVCLQKNQIGVDVLAMVRFHEVCGGLDTLAVKMKPLSKPPASWVHGSANEVCETV